MKNKPNLTRLITEEIVKTANDIDLYLVSSAPIECYRKDIDKKLMAMKIRIIACLIKSAKTGKR